jgi:cytochrome oxidase Cu insertion factor (SCO1/SenC/PrrC family)
MRITRRGWLALGGLFLASAIAAAYVDGRAKLPAEEPRRADAARLMNDLMSGKADIGGPFTLAGEGGKRVSLADFSGKVVVLYFGYTFCPDVCPTDLHTIAAALDALGADRDKVQPVFITLDPERDTPAQLAAYVKSFSPRFVPLSGTEQETRAVATAYKVFYEKVRPPGSSHYVIDHTAFTFIIDQQGKYAGFFPPGTGADRMTGVVRELVGGR